MQLIDAHAHLTFDELENQIDDVLARSAAAGVTGWVTVGTDPEHNRRAVDLAGRYDNLYAAVGIHPHYAKDTTDADIAQLEKYLADPKVVAVGETGLDFHYNLSSPELQYELFRTHLDLAAKHDKPVIIHSRNAFDDTISILDYYRGKLSNVVIHCFTYGPDEVRQFLDRGFYISFTGVVTFKSADLTRQAAALVPPERMMVETDCPYMSPHPVRKQKINEPALMVHTASLLAEVTGHDLGTFAQKTYQATKSFFGI